MIDQPQAGRAPTLPWRLLVGMVAVGFSLRTLMAALPPLVPQIQADLMLRGDQLGALTTVPVACMGLFAPVAPQLAARLGTARTISVGTVLIAMGNLLRAIASPLPLYVGTAVAGVGIAVVGTILPGFIKASFSASRSGLITGLQMVAMMGGASLASAVSVPLAQQWHSWAAALAVWGFVALAGLVVWLMATRRTDTGTTGPAPVTTPARQLPWRNATAWLVAAFLATQSWQFYSALTWLAPTYVARGWSPADAGWLLSLFNATQLIGGLAAPWLSDHVRSLRALLVSASLMGFVALAGITALPDQAGVLWTVLLGLSQGGAFALGLVLLVRYAASPAASARLTGMAFFVSYSVASIGPSALGAVHDAAGSFTAVWVSLIVVNVGQTLLALRTRRSLPAVT